MLEAWLELLWIAPALRSPLAGWLVQRATREAPAAAASDGPPGHRVDPARVAALVDAAGRHHLKGMTCLERALTLQRMLRRRGLIRPVRLGVQRVADAVEAHAWVEGLQQPPHAPLQRAAPAADPATDRHCFWVAGLAVRCHRPIPGLRPRVDAGAAPQVRVRFGPPTGDPPGAGTTGWHPLPPGVCAPSPGIFISPDGRQVYALLPEHPWEHLQVLLRRALPFAAALQGRVLLHASAVACPGGVAAFVGPSGVGKSSLARALSALGLAAVADDLLPLADPPHHAGVLLPGGGKVRPLTRLCFLQRQAGLRRPALTPLAEAELLELLLRNGFGELPLPQIWSLQFERYGQLARRVPGFLLRLPDDPAAVTRSARQVARWLGASPAAAAAGPHPGPGRPA